ncbi:MAG: hypothetical protein IJ570_05000 [Prevotella sp.]|nr:hypothetical protein [Bacteroidaceae bacterium]MBR1415204.1 hypothetical protein [Prevotella sp.]
MSPASRTYQLSLGGGYSYNLVVLNREERGPHLRGFRNLTFNATLMPMVTMLSIDRVSFDVNFHYDNFRFNTGTQTENMDIMGAAVQQNRMKGRFYNWGVEAELQIKF